jgi:hypothetical protein
VLRDQDRPWKRVRQRYQQGFERRRPSRRRAHEDEAVAGGARRAKLALARDGRGIPAPRAVQHTLPQSRALFYLRAGRSSDFFQEYGCKFINAQRYRAFGLQHEIDGPETQSFERLLGSFRRQRRHHDHGARPLEHDAIETFEAAHLRHVNVERDDGRVELFDLLQRLDAVACNSNL